MSKTTIMRGFLATGSEGEISIGSQSPGSQVGNGKDRAGRPSTAAPAGVGAAIRQGAVKRSPRHKISLVRQTRAARRQPRSRDFRSPASDRVRLHLIGDVVGLTDRQ